MKILAKSVDRVRRVHYIDFVHRVHAAHRFGEILLFFDKSMRVSMGLDVHLLLSRKEVI
jgi:hypothetical protein